MKMARVLSLACVSIHNKTLLSETTAKCTRTEGQDKKDDNVQHKYLKKVELREDNARMTCI